MSAKSLSILIIIWLVWYNDGVYKNGFRRANVINSNGRHFEFGKGDIGIHMGDTSDVTLLLFRNLDTPAPIGKLLNRQRRRKVEILDSDVVMSFSNTDSIDALMKCLKVIRRNLGAANAQNNI